MHRYKKVRCLQAKPLWRCAANNKVQSTRNFVDGTTTLAMKISKAMSHEPDFQNSITP